MPKLDTWTSAYDAALKGLEHLQVPGVEACRAHGSVLGCPAIQFGPDADPVVGPEVTAGDFAFGGQLDLHAALDGDRPVAICPLRNQWRRHLQLVSEGLARAPFTEVFAKFHAPYISDTLTLVNSVARISSFSRTLSNSRVKPVGEIRRDNLLILVRDKAGGVVAKLNEMLGRDRTDATLSQYINRSKDSKTKKPKMMGGGMARKIEAALGLPGGWMDTPHAAQDQAGDQDQRLSDEQIRVLALWERMAPSDRAIVLADMTQRGDRFQADLVATRQPVTSDNTSEISKPSIGEKAQTDPQAGETKPPLKEVPVERDSVTFNQEALPDGKGFSDKRQRRKRDA